MDEAKSDAAVESFEGIEGVGGTKEDRDGEQLLGQHLALLLLYYDVKFRVGL